MHGGARHQAVVAFVQGQVDLELARQCLQPPEASVVAGVLVLGLRWAEGLFHPLGAVAHVREGVVLGSLVSRVVTHVVAHAAGRGDEVAFGLAVIAALQLLAAGAGRRVALLHDAVLQVARRAGVDF